MKKAIVCIILVISVAMSLCVPAFAAVSNNYVRPRQMSQQLIVKTCKPSQNGKYFISVYNHGRTNMVFTINGAYYTPLAAGERVDIYMGNICIKKNKNRNTSMPSYVVRVFCNQGNAWAYGQQYVQILTNNGTIR